MSLDDLIAELSDVERDRTIELKRELQEEFGKVQVDFRYVGMVNGVLDHTLSRAGRLAFFTWAFGHEIKSSHDLTSEETYTLVRWAGMHKGNMDEAWRLGQRAMRDLPLLIKLFLGGIGQLPLLDAPKRKRNAAKELGFYD